MSKKLIRQSGDNAATQRGASVNVVSKNDVFESWRVHHWVSARMSLQKIFAEPWSCLMTSLVIGIALALPASLLLIVENIKTLSGSWDGAPQISVYVRQTIPSTAIVQLGNKLKRIPGVQSVIYISPDAGLEEFKKYSGFGEALALLDANPLPSVYQLSPMNQETSALTALVLQLRTMPEVEAVQLDLEWVKKLQQAMNMTERFVYLFGFLLCLGVLLSIGNTMRLMIEKRKDEIVVVKLIGATDAFVRRPLLYTGLWFGLMGGISACLITLLTLHLLAEPAEQLALLYHSAFTSVGLGLQWILELLAISSLLGLLGAWISTERHLHQVQPR